MQLPAEQLAMILQEIHTIRARGPGMDKRRSPRHECNASAVITLLESGAPSLMRRESSTVTIKNYSGRGVSFLNPRALPSGAQFVLPISDLSGKTIFILCAVTHSRMMTEHLYIVGAEFMEVATAEAIESGKIGRGVPIAARAVAS